MTPAEPPAWRWQTHAALGSTQDAALDAARAGDPGRLAVWAATQTAGRGSRGRSWAAPRGNLNLSLLVRPAHDQAEPGRWALLAALSLHGALAPYADGLMLKWPNDILLHGAKLGGILIDSQSGATGPDWVVIGFGANLAAAPALPDRPAACLPAPPPDAYAVAAQVAAVWDAHAAMDTPRLVEAWLARAHPIGTVMDVRTPQRRLQGAFAGLTRTGALKLQGHPQPISSAEVFVHA